MNINKDNLRQWLRTLCAMTAMVCAVLLANIAWQYWQAQSFTEHAQEMFLEKPSVQPERDIPLEQPVDSAEKDEPPSQPAPPPSPPSPPSVNFDALAAESPDAVAWLWISGTGISYPVVQGDDNERYLNHAYNGKNSVAGSVFMDYRNNSGLSDQNTILYGHNMKDRSMFGSLKQYHGQEFADAHREIHLITKEGTYRFIVFAVYSVRATDMVAYTPNYENTKDYVTAIQNALKRSSIATDVSPDAAERLLTLSTCTASDANRLIVQAYWAETVQP